MHSAALLEQVGGKTAPVRICTWVRGPRALVRGSRRAAGAADRQPERSRARARRRTNSLGARRPWRLRLGSRGGKQREIQGLDALLRALLTALVASPHVEH